LPRRYISQGFANLREAVSALNSIVARAAYGINIKLQKAGGIWPGKKVKLMVMVGSMLEGPLANMAGLHFAVSAPTVMLSDLDMDLDMPEHVRGRARLEGRMRLPGEGPGFGIEYDHDKIRALIRSGKLIYERII
jgi:L-alanine-DL-glutamate epimerase-like enolase superfamily enzyme